jgi:hypothetical protein
MTKLVLTIALFVTAANVAIGVSYAAVCADTNGNRYCGTLCIANADGKSCQCSGTCTSDERDWVAKKGEDDEELELVLE